MTRRQFVTTIAKSIPAIYLLELSFQTDAFGTPVKPTMAKWLRDLHEMCMDLKVHTLTPIQWQNKIEQLYSQIELPDLLEFIRFEHLVEGLEYPENMAAVRSVKFPEIEGIPSKLKFGRKIFALGKGTAIVPHGHNNMVSSHLVVRGKFHVRTYNRVRDEKGFLVVSPSIDERFRPGRVLTMSDLRDNVHWLVAESDYAFTFDVPVVNIFPDKKYATPAQHHGMIHIDPHGEKTEDGHIRAKVIDPKFSIDKFGGGSIGSFPNSGHEI